MSLRKLREREKLYMTYICIFPSSFSSQSKKALKSILQKCTYLPGLEPLLYDVPSNILKYVVCQFSKVSDRQQGEWLSLQPQSLICINIFFLKLMSVFVFVLLIKILYLYYTLFLISSKVLPNDSKARRLFVTSGGLKKVQEIDAEPGSSLQEHINAINSCFPEEIVRCVSLPTHTDTHMLKQMLCWHQNPLYGTPLRYLGVTDQTTSSYTW